MNKLLLIPLVFLMLFGCGQNPATSSGNAAQPDAPNSAAGAGTAPAAPTTPRPSPALAPVRIPAGTVLRVRLVQALDTERNKAGDRFEATLAAPVTKDGATVIPAGATFRGHVTAAKPSGRLKGRGYMNLTLDSFELNGKTYEIETSVVSRVTGAHKKRNIALIGGGSGVGALVGALAGGGSGAAIGAAAGAGAGLGGAALTGKKHVRIPSETVLSFKLRAPVETPPRPAA